MSLVRTRGDFLPRVVECLYLELWRTYSTACIEGPPRVSLALETPLTASLCDTLQHTAPHCNILQHIATHCNIEARLTAGALCEKSVSTDTRPECRHPTLNPISNVRSKPRETHVSKDTPQKPTPYSRMPTPYSRMPTPYSKPNLECQIQTPTRKFGARHAGLDGMGTVFSGVGWALLYTHTDTHCGVATISRLLKMIGLFCKRAL